MQGLYVLESVTFKTNVVSLGGLHSIYNNRTFDIKHKDDIFRVRDIQSEVLLELSLNDLKDLLMNNSVFGLVVKEKTSDSLIIPIKYINGVHLSYKDNKFNLMLQGNIINAIFNYSLDEFKIIGNYLEKEGVKFYQNLGDCINVSDYIDLVMKK